MLAGRSGGDNLGLGPQPTTGGLTVTIAGLPTGPAGAVIVIVIVPWMSYWPLSVVATVPNDRIHRFFPFVFRRSQSLMQSIADYVVANIQVK